MLGGKQYVDIGDNIAKSARFRASASAHLSRSFSVTPTTRTKCAISAWVKRGTLGVASHILTWYSNGNNTEYLRFNSSDQLEYVQFFGAVTLASVVSAASYRDVAGWYHVYFEYDSTQATASNRVKMWVNGVQITTFTGTPTYPGSNNPLGFGYGAGSTPGTHYVSVYDGASFWADQHIARLDLITESPAFTGPSQFGRTSPQTGAWVPKSYTGSYSGQNSFSLRFLTVGASTDFGIDSSGNGLTFNVNNLSATAGITYDWSNDSPTNKYPSLSSIDNSGFTVSEAGTRVAASGSSSYIRSTFALRSGKWWFEVVVNTSSQQDIGLMGSQQALSGSTARIMYRQDGSKVVDGSVTAHGATFTTGDVIGIAADISGGSISFYKQTGGTGSFVLLGTAISYAFTSNADYSPALYGVSSNMLINFGQRTFNNSSIPSGCLPICAANLPAGVIIKGSKYFDVNTRTGNSPTPGSVTGKAFQPDLVWVKERNGTRDHRLIDSVRGATKELYSSLTTVETPDAQGLTSFNSDGFSFGTSASINANGSTEVDWMWKKGALPGFDIKDYSGTGASQSPTHSLGVTPKLVIVKRRTGGTADWAVHHANLTSTSHYLLLNSTNAQANYGSAFIAPNASTFALDATSTLLNASGSTYIAYLWAEIAGFSRIGSYVGNGSVDGPFVWCGFRPRFVMIKNATTGTTDWLMVDTARSTYNVTSANLWANLSNIEGVANRIDVNSGGFKLRNNFSEHNSNGDTFIFAAFAELPFKYANAR